MADVTRILSQIEQGDPSAADQLLPLVYDELRKLGRVPLPPYIRKGEMVDRDVQWYQTLHRPTHLTSPVRA